VLLDPLNCVIGCDQTYIVDYCYSLTVLFDVSKISNFIRRTQVERKRKDELVRITINQKLVETGEKDRWVVMRVLVIVQF